MFQRRLVLLIGERAWSEQVTNITLAKLRPKLRVLRADLRDPPQRAWMGQELDVVVLTAHRRRFLDTFGAVAGTLKAGGILLFQTPPWEVWSQERLGARWCKLLTSLCNDPRCAEFITVYKEEDGFPQQEMIDSIDSLNLLQVHRKSVVLTPNAEQKTLIQNILKIKSSRPLLIFGRRGRGKSACLGMAAAVLLQRGCRIVVTSPSKEATSQLFWSAETFLGEALPRNLNSQKAGIDFIDPQVLVRGHYDLKETFLIVDEAAGFPVNFTVELLQNAGRVLLATTLDGYEGSGNGFLVRAVPRLRQWRKGLQIQELTTSWRWTEGCPLEALARSAMLLDAAPVTLTSENIEIVAQEAQVERVEREQLQEEELKKLYGLLRIGHYKTKPSDLETFLDAKGIIWLSLKSAENHVGLTISGIEEPVEDAFAEELWLGRRQVPQNLSAQILSRDAGILEASQLRFVRMMRWCLHPKLRGYGLGERLLEQSLAHLKKNAKVDAVAAHFGATSWLMKLWLRHAFVVFVSHNYDPSSGQHSVSVLIPLTDAAHQLVTRLQHRLVLQIFDLLCGPLADLDGDAVKELLKALPLHEVHLETISDAWSFAFGARGLSHCKHGLCRTVYRALMCARTCTLPKKEEDVLLALLQGRPIRSEDQLRRIVRKLLSTSRPE